MSQPEDADKNSKAKQETDHDSANASQSVSNTVDLSMREVPQTSKQEGRPLSEQGQRARQNFCHSKVGIKNSNQEEAETDSVVSSEPGFRRAHSTHSFSLNQILDATCQATFAKKIFEYSLVLQLVEESDEQSIMTDKPIEKKE